MSLHRPGAFLEEIDGFAGFSVVRADPMQLRAVIFAIGLMVALLGIAMLPSAMLDIADGSDDWHIFLISSAISVLVGVGLAVLSGGAPPSTNE